MGDKHLFKKKKNETPETITPDSNVDTRPDTAVQGQNEPEQNEPEQKEFVYGMDQTEQDSEDVQSGTKDADCTHQMRTVPLLVRRQMKTS